MNKKEKRNYFYIHGKLPGLNEYTYACRSSWQKGAKMKADIEKQISIAVGIAKNQKQLFPVKEPVYVDFIWFEDDFIFEFSSPLGDFVFYIKTENYFNERKRMWFSSPLGDFCFLYEMRKI